ncbi:MAG: hypothetical protein BroJett011_65620 [Chloroflexota bacterium]|nr:MAG: hypothetical protein BroJett011_65620 [Chloroflexota bacterium]
MAAVRRFQSGNQPEQRRFAAAGRAKQAQNLALVKSQTDLNEGRDIGKRFGEIVNFKQGQRVTPSMSPCRELTIAAGAMLSLRLLLAPYNLPPLEGFYFITEKGQ